MAERVTTQRILEHVQRLGEQFPPIPLETVDRTIHHPREVVSKYGYVIDFLARVELEVDRNVLELLTLLPDVDDVNKMFYADVWQPQEIQHGLILDRLQQDLGRPPATPVLEVNFGIKAMGALSNFSAVQDVAKFMYYLTGASTERQAVLAYNVLTKGLKDIGEPEINETIIGPIKRQEPGHFAFYRMSAEEMVQSGALRPWQLFLARTLRARSYHLVGVKDERTATQMGHVISTLGFDQQLERYAKEVGRIEANLLWANRNGMEFPPYVLKALRESVELYAENGFGDIAPSAPA
ncbi:MAG: GTP-binding protein LepA [Beutenbergiaceae bacterium]